MNQEEKIKTEYDEIDLVDYVKVLVKRKWLILIIFLAVVIVAGAFSILMPKIYKIDTFLEIGTGLEEPIQLVEKIDYDIYGLRVREKLNIPEESFPKIKAENPKDTNLVQIKIESANHQTAKNILEEINKLILADHQEKIIVKKTILKEDIERLRAKIDSLEEEKKNLEAKIEALERVILYQQTPGSQFALFDTKEKLEKKKQEIEGLYLKINSSENALEDIRPTKIIKSPTISVGPIKPRLLFNIAIAGVLGLFLGIVLALGKEWWEKNKAKI